MWGHGDGGGGDCGSCARHCWCCCLSIWRASLINNTSSYVMWLLHTKHSKHSIASQSGLKQPLQPGGQPSPLMPQANFISSGCHNMSLAWLMLSLVILLTEVTEIRIDWSYYLQSLWVVLHHLLKDENCQLAAPLLNLWDPADHLTSAPNTPPCKLSFLNFTDKVNHEMAIRFALLFFCLAIISITVMWW